VTAPLPLALSCGDPAGIGGEIAAAAWRALGAEAPFALIGDADWAAGFGVPVARIDAIEDAAAAAQSALPVLHRPFPAPVTLGIPAPANAAAVIASIEDAVALTRAGRAAGVVTLPINKKALKDGAGFAHPGHTEFLAHLDGAACAVMLLMGPAMKVVPVTIHIALADVPRALTVELLTATARIVHAALIRDFAIARPRIAVAGLNPHAGEGGVMGHEEIDLIAPAIARLREDGLTLTGPLPADTMFHPAARAKWDAALCMYHDQALIPIKTLDFDRGVNTTLGLSFVRTSPDHGTAYDIAGKGLASALSLIEAIRAARDMAACRAAFDAATR
jgi:4-hydroxythreonine-4-phosphate dehydrogenase